MKKIAYCGYYNFIAGNGNGHQNFYGGNKEEWKPSICNSYL